MVATDRISAFDYILEDEIPCKGQVLTQLSCFWFELLDGVVENHLISADVADLPGQFKPYADYLRGRFMLVKKADMFPLECIVRGYLAGSGLKEYQKQGTVCGIELPSGLANSSKLPEPIYTPSTKAEIGGHDENISFERSAELVGEEDASRLRDLAIAVYSKARDHAAAQGIIIADTKFEFGRVDGKIILADEVLTPTRRGSGRATSTQKARTNPASTSSSCAIGWTPTGIARAIRRACRRRSSRRRARSTSRHTRRSPALGSADLTIGGTGRRCGFPWQPILPLQAFVAYRSCASSSFHGNLGHHENPR